MSWNAVRRHRIRTLFAAGILTATTMVIQFAPPTAAISKQYYDDVNDIAGSSNVQVAGVVGRNPYVNKASLKAVAYFTSRSGGTITFRDYAFCPANTLFDDNGNGGATGQNITRYRIVPIGGAEIIRYGKKNQGCRNELTVNVSFPSSVDPDSSTGYYKAAITVTHLNGNNVQNMFRIVTNGAAVSHQGEPNGEGSEVTVEQADASPQNIDYVVPFGADCSVTARTKSKISLYDIDNDGGSGAQRNGKVSVDLLLVGGGVRQITTNSNMSNLRNRITPPSNSNATTNIYFYAYPGDRYRLRLSNVYHNNTLQFNVPFDGIFYNTGCKRWNLTPNTYIKRNTSGWTAGNITAAPGDKVDWEHRVSNGNAGVADTTGQVERFYPGDSGYSAYGAVKTFSDIQPNSTQKYSGVSATTVTIPSTATSGSKYCQRYRIKDSHMSAGILYGPQYSTPRCVTVANTGYDLKPAITLIDPSDGTYPQATRFNVQGAVTNEGSTTTTQHKWQIYRAKYSTKPDQTLADTSTEDPCSNVATAGHVECERLGEDIDFYPTISSQGRLHNQEDPDDIGTYTCFFTRVQKPTPTSADALWAYSDMVCAVAGIKPKIQVLGGDLRVGGSGNLAVSTSLTVLSSGSASGMYGSWGEYGVLVDQGIENTPSLGIASGAGLSGGAATGSTIDNRSPLTFSNDGDACETGEVASFGCFGDALRTLSAPESGAITYDDGHDLGGEAMTGRKVIVVNGTARITNDMAYGNSYGSVGALPRVLIFATNFVIDPDVRRIDPWLIASGDGENEGWINTCATVPTGTPYNEAGLFTGMCGRQLVFNGPVYANKIYLYRTAGSRLSGTGDAARTSLSAPAEVFNLRPDAYLSSLSGSGAATPIATTNYVRELPPRF